MNRFYKDLFLLFILFFSSNLVNAQVGVYDESFGTGGKVFQSFNGFDFTPKAVLLQSDSKLIVAGSGGDFFEGYHQIVRYNSNGTTDGSFGNNGIVTFTVESDENMLQSIVLQPDGKIIAAGITKTFDQVTQQTDKDFHLYRLKTDGSLDSSFGTNGMVVTDIAAHSNDELHEIVLKPDGKIIAGGYYMDMNNGDNFYSIVQYKTDGSRDSSFGTNGITVVALDQQDEGKGSLALLPNGKILAATTVVNDTSFFYEFGLIRFNANGSIDAGFGNGGIVHLGLSYFHSILHDMAVQADGKIVLTGQSQSGNATVIAVVRVNSEGMYDPAFGDNGVVKTHISTEQFAPDAGMTLVVQPDNKVIVGCTLDNAINSIDANFAVIRYLANGAIDDKFGRQGIIITDFNENGDFSTACLQQPDGKFVLVGSAGSQNFEMGFGIVRYLSDARFYYNTLKGSVFYDNNINGIKDAGEDFFSNAMVAARKTGVDTINITASTGRFSVDVDTGNYVIYPVQSASHVPYYITFPNTRTINHPTYFNTDSVSFAMQPIPGMRDLFVYIVPLVSARPGFTTDYMIVYGNKGTDTVPSGSVQFVPDNRVDVTSADPGPSSVSGDTMRWNYVNLLPHDTAFIFVHATIQPPPNVNIGDTLHSFASILPAGFDQDPKDNSFILHEDVIGSFDPNDKNENHAGQMSLNQLNAGEYLQYVIRFQNTGTDTAFNVYVRDTLANNLDWSTMEMLSASHSYGLVMNDGICVWTFNRIDLLAATQNEPASHGYIVFRIRPASTFTIGNNINNTAAIFFDYNLPVITNTETTILVSTPVPVKLLNFNAKKNGKTHQLSWSTTNEINADRFEIERSANGIIFDKIGSLSTSVASTVIKNYNYTDALPLNGTNYYRLRVVDKDGRFEYGPVRILSNTAEDYFTIYPNPVRDDIYLKAESKHPAAWLIQVLSADGKRVSSDTWNVDGGVSVKTIKTRNLGAGTYFIKIIAAAGSSINDNTEPVSIKFNKL